MTHLEALRDLRSLYGYPAVCMLFFVTSYFGFDYTSQRASQPYDKEISELQKQIDKINSDVDEIKRDIKAEEQRISDFQNELLEIDETIS